jgi:hypothetical protein
LESFCHFDDLVARDAEVFEGWRRVTRLQLSIVPPAIVPGTSLLRFFQQFPGPPLGPNANLIGFVFGFDILRLLCVVFEGTRTLSRISLTSSTLTHPEMARRILRGINGQPHLIFGLLSVPPEGRAMVRG